MSKKIKNIQSSSQALFSPFSLTIVFYISLFSPSGFSHFSLSNVFSLSRFCMFSCISHLFSFLLSENSFRPYNSHNMNFISKMCGGISTSIYPLVVSMLQELMSFNSTLQFRLRLLRCKTVSRKMISVFMVFTET